MSDDDKWDSENFRTQSKSSPMGLISNQWDGEDEEEEVKDSWDDPEEEDQDGKNKEEAQTVKAIQVKKQKKLSSKIEEKEKREELERRTLQERKQMTPEEIHEEKLRQQNLQEQADLEVAKQLLGVSIKSDITVLESKEDFDKYSDEIIRHISSVTKNQNFPVFVEQLVQQLCVHLSAAELKKVHTFIGNLQIEKNKMEQGVKSKKKGKGKATLNIDDDMYSPYGEDLYDDFM